MPTQHGVTKSPAVIPSGEGERRAQRGYVPQYQLAARVIYQALASNELKWVGWLIVEQEPLMTWF